LDKLQTSLDNQIAKFQKILQANPDDVSVLMAYAEANLRKGNRLEAMKAYQRLSRLSPGETEVRISLARIYASTNQQHDAFFEIKTVLEIDSANIEAHLLLRGLSRQFKIPNDLKGFLEQHLSFQAPAKIVRIHKRLHEMEARKFQMLIDEYDRQLEEDSGNPIVVFNRKKAQDRLHSAEEALQDLQDMVMDQEEDTPESFQEEEAQVSFVVPEVQEPEEEAAPAYQEEEYEDAAPHEAYAIEEPAEETAMGLEEGYPEEEGHWPQEDESIQEIPGDYPEVEEEPDQSPGEEEFVMPGQDEPEEAEPEIPLEEEASFQGEDIPPLYEDQQPGEAMTGPPEEEDTAEPPAEAEEDAISPARQEFYARVAGDLEEILTAIFQTRGVSSSLVLDGRGNILCHTGADSGDPEALAALIIEGVEPLLAWTEKAGRLMHWILEFDKGLLFLLPLGGDLYLTVIGKTEANLGTVKYSVEKHYAPLARILKGLPS
jgi:tetratricopeptide (TPR) repeat protein/predicted regulator of Ras-like GTPase activity (Roadblock/LC7/MglB family)